MKKISILSITLLSIIIFANYALATVGGPTLISDLKYDPISKLVYYTEHDEGGKGCPPILKSLNPISGQTKTIFSCDYGLNQPRGYSQYDTISNFTKNFQTLAKVDMNKSDIFIEIKNTNYEQVQMYEGKKIIATITQSDIASKQLETTICESNDPVTIDTYVIPSIMPEGPRTNTAIFLFSRIGLCYEGGYIKESIHSIPGFDVSKMTLTKSWYKSSEPALPSAYNKVVYPDAKIPSETDIVSFDNKPIKTIQDDIKPIITPSINQPQTSESSDKSTEYLIIILLVLILGVLLGKSIHSKK